MKIIKFNESIETKPQIGDYVICKEKDYNDETEDRQIREFLVNNIGEVVAQPSNQDGHWDRRQLKNFIWVKFEKNYIPDPDGLFENNIRPFYIEEIIHLAPNKEDLEHLIAAPKYNL